VNKTYQRGLCIKRSATVSLNMFLKTYNIQPEE